MSKQKQPPVLEHPVPAAYLTPPSQIPIGDALGKMVECPICGKPAYVDHARGARTQTQVISSRWWVLVKCKGFCGSMLSKIATMVTLMPESIPVPVFKPLGEAVGHFILCPQCHSKAQAAWNLDDGHVINCPTCGHHATDGQMPVELVA